MTAIFTPYQVFSNPQAVSNPTINSGTGAGQVYTGQGNDFLDPDKILKDINNFSTSVNPVTSNTWTNLLAPPIQFERLDDPNEIVDKTTDRLNEIFSPTFGQNLNINVPVLSGGIPDLGTDPDPVRIALSTLFFAGSLQPQSYPNNPNNYNPYAWQNPSSMNILLGTQQAQNNIVGTMYPSFGASPGSFSMLG